MDKEEEEVDDDDEKKKKKKKKKKNKNKKQQHLHRLINKPTNKQTEASNTQTKTGQANERNRKPIKRREGGEGVDTEIPEPSINQSHSSAKKERAL